MLVPSLASSAGSSLARTSCNVCGTVVASVLQPSSLAMASQPFVVWSDLSLSFLINSPLVSPSFYPVLLASPLNVAEFAQSLLGNLIQETILYVINRLQHSFRLVF